MSESVWLEEGDGERVLYKVIDRFTFDGETYRVIARRPELDTERIVDSEGNAYYGLKECVPWVSELNEENHNDD